ncbi:Mitogen-activated protein kinase kinase 6 MPKK6 [Gracilaria domingensis]|nr:Mitogen-activated protein kinase kinase 6 MPKK6 [Gracilaria domingensis]
MSSVDHLFRREDNSKRSARASVPQSAGHTLATKAEPRVAPRGSAQPRAASSLSAPRSHVQRISSSLSPQGRITVPQKKKEDIQKQSLSQRSSSAGQVLDFDATAGPRSSADDACPAREREPAMALGRSQSTPGKRSSSLKRRMRLNLPLLKIPTSTNSNSTNVSFKSVRNSSGERRAIRDDSIVYAGLVGQETPRHGTQANVPGQSPVRTSQPPSSKQGSRSSPSAFSDADQVKRSLPKPQNGVWKAFSPKIADGTDVEVLNHLTEADQELLLPEYVEPISSQTRTIRKVNSTLHRPSTPSTGFAEDSFILQIEDAYVDGGFVISLNGLEGTPEKLVRKVSNGMDNDGVPTSSRNLIIVRSLDEFTRVRTFRGSGTLGRGITGSVYLARHEPTKKFVAVKRINAFDEKKREELKKELTTLISHESRFLVRSHGAFYDGMNGVHIVLEYMDRGSLSDVVSQYGKIPEPVLRKITEHCLLGLRFLHENHVLHRDVKTANILMSSKVGRAKLGDFGLARDLKERNANCNSIGEGSTSETETFVGTFQYMSPERLNGSKYTYASDIWGLGMVVIEGVLGKPPFASLHQFFEIVNFLEHTRPVSFVEGCVSPELADFIRLCTVHDAKGRPPASELLRHPWIRAGHSDRNVLKRWLNELPAMHHDIMGERSGGSVRAQARQLERMRETNQLR